MGNLAKGAETLTVIVSIIGLSGPTAAQDIRIREGTALARLVGEVTSHGPEMALAAAPSRGKSISRIGSPQSL